MSRIIIDSMFRFFLSGSQHIYFAQSEKISVNTGQITYRKAQEHTDMH